MKFALVDGKKIEASKGAKGTCPSCESKLISKCGEIKVNHWAHKGNRNCDIWWENETGWHRSWKNEFPIEWQEVVHRDESGEKHIADVKTEAGWTLEFQHSAISPKERQSRNTFYKKLIWIVDGTRLKTNVSQFQRLLEDGCIESNNPPLEIRRVNFPEENRLLREWHDCDAIVFFDFQQTIDKYETMLWFIIPGVSDNEAYISTLPRDLFIKAHNENGFDVIVNKVIFPIQRELISKKARQEKAQYFKF